MKELSAPLSAEEIDPVLDFADRGLVQQHIPTAPRLCLLAAVEELFFAVLAAGLTGQVRCMLDGSGGVRLFFQTERDALLPAREELALPEGLFFLREEATYTLAVRPALSPDL